MRMQPKLLGILFLPLLLASRPIAVGAASSTAWSDPAAHREGFVRTNSVRLQYLDWGGKGPALILIHGISDNPHAFDDLAPAFTDRFHVIAYARRAHGRSEVKPPYDVATLTEDLRGLMDRLGIAKAHLVGWSMGGDEITAMAGKYPQRVGRLVYLDGAFDWAEPEWTVAVDAVPASIRQKPAAAMASMGAYLSYIKATRYSALDDMRRVEAHVREGVVIQPDGSLQDRIPKEAMDALIHTLLHDRRDYTRVRAPVLAINSESMFDLSTADAQMRNAALAWEQKYRVPFRAKSVQRIRKELANVEVVDVPGSHVNFFLTSKAQVVEAMRRFLQEPAL